MILGSFALVADLSQYRLDPVLRYAVVALATLLAVYTARRGADARERDQPRA